MFHDTLKNNLLFAKPDATDEELVDSLKKANIYDLIETLPQVKKFFFFFIFFFRNFSYNSFPIKKGLNTVLGNRGYRLSGGERQRLAISRVFLKDPKVIFFLYI